EWYGSQIGQDYHAMITVDQVATCKEMLLNGVGVTILPEIMMKHLDREQFAFQRVDIDDKPLIRSTYLSYDPSMLQLPQVDLFNNDIREIIILDKCIWWYMDKYNCMMSYMNLIGIEHAKSLLNCYI